MSLLVVRLPRICSNTLLPPIVFVSAFVCVAMVPMATTGDAHETATGQEPVDDSPANSEADDSPPAAVRKPAGKSDATAAAGVNRVVDLAAGRPVAGATVGFYLDRFDRSRPIGLATTNALGAFEYPPETPEKETFYVEISAPGYLTDQWLGNWTVYRKRKGNRRADTFVLHRPVTLGGRVLGPNGKPLADVPLAFDYFNERVASINARTFHSDAQGRFHLEGLPPGELFVRLQRGESPADEDFLAGAQFAIVHVHASDGENHDNLVIDLSQSTCVIEGRLVDPAKKGIEGEWVYAAFEFSSRRLDHRVHVMTAADGSFRMTGLPPGHFVLQVAHRQLNRVELQAGRPARVELLGYTPGAPAPPDRQHEPAWGEMHRGVQVGAVIEPRKETYAIGDKLLVSVLLRNQTNESITTTFNSLGGAAVEIADDAGNVRVFDYSHLLGMIASDTYYLQPGHEVAFEGAFSLVLTDERDEPNNADGQDGFVVACRPGSIYQLVCRVTRPGESVRVRGNAGAPEGGALRPTTAPVAIVVAP